MIRIVLNVKHSSPFLQTVSGEVVVEYIDYRNLDADKQVEPVLVCEFSCKPNQLGYTNKSGFNSAIFEGLKSQIDTMIHSYRRGMLLSPHDYSWVEDSADKPLETWKQEKVRQYEITNEHKHGKCEGEDKQ